MKVLISSLVLVAASLTAKAEVKPPGTFIPTECGTQKMVASPAPAASIERVCIGLIAGKKRTSDMPQAMQFFYNDGGSELFYVANSFVATSGSFSPFNQVLFEIQNVEGQWESVRLTIGLNGETLLAGQIRQTPFAVTDLQPAVTTQGMLETDSIIEPVKASPCTGGRLCIDLDLNDTLGTEI